MEVYAASDGYVLQLTKGLSEFTSVDELSSTIAPHLDLQAENVLLFLEDGREVKDWVLAEALDRGGSGQGSKPKTEVLYLFNRETFWTEPEEWAEKYQEEIYYPPPLDAGAIDEVSVAEAPFSMAQDHVHHILSLFQAQWRALSLAYQNLEHHLQPLRDEWDILAGVASQQLREQEGLLDSAPSDLAILPKVTIHPTFWSKRDQAGNIISRSKDEAKDKTLADYIHSRKMEEVMETCRVSHVEMQDRFLQLAAQMDEIVQISEVEKDKAGESAMAVQLEFERALQRLQDGLQAMSEAADGDRLVEVALTHDEIMRADLTHLTALKNEYTLDVHIHLRQVAQLESRIAEVVIPFRTLETDFKSKGAFPHLSRLHELPFAYLALVLEYRWRKEYGEQFARWCNRLAQAIGGMLAPEIKRREALNKEILSFNPFAIYGLDDSTSIYCETTYHTGAEALEVMTLDKSLSDGDLDDWIRRLVNEIDTSFPPGPGREALYDVVKRLTARYEDFKLQYLSRPASSLEVQWDTAVAAHMHGSRQPQLSDEIDDERERIHQDELEQYRQRQEEMEEELVKLKSERDDEALARQALSAELEVRNRASEDRQRDQEDQSELITALHAEVAQEKDRATDLGVRLQEALLDVDGMKNAEQTLIARIEEMKDERTKRSQELSDAHIQLADLRMTITGLQAQLTSATGQLNEAREERDATLRNLSTEAERVMRDRIAEADGDRAVLEHENVTLNQQLARLKVEMDERVNSTRNTAVRQIDGYKAELSLSKAQLRDAQRREAVLSDELAMLKDSANALSSDRSHQSEMAKDAVAIATRFYETCRPLSRLINSMSSSKRPDGEEADKDYDAGKQRAGSPASAAPSTSEMRESVLVRSLASAQNFDLDGFAEGVNRLIARSKRYAKAYKHQRDLARNKVTFTDFQKGDVALFLPVRDPSRGLWAAFNVNAPHNFLKLDDKLQEEAKSRAWIMARITSSEEAVAGETDETNPVGLTPGLRYQMHKTEPFESLAVAHSLETSRLSRRSTSMGANSLLLQDASPNQPSRLRSLTTKSVPATDAVAPSSGPEPVTETPSGLSTSLRETAPITMTPAGVTQGPDSYFPQIAPVDVTPTTRQTDHPAPTDTVPPPLRKSPDSKSHEKPETVDPLQSPVPDATTTTSIPTRTSQHGTSVRTTVSPTMREAAVFAPSSFGRPPSVASSASSYPRGIPLGTTTGKGAPAMAVTTSDGSGGRSPGDRGPFLDDNRRASGSSFTGLQREESGGVGRSPLATASNTNPSSIAPLDRPSASGNATPRTVSRGFSIGAFGKKRTASNASAATGDKAQTAVDILKQYDDKK